MTETEERDEELDAEVRDRRLLAQTPYDPDSDRSLTATLVAAIAEAEGVAPSDVGPPPLYDYVDVAAVEAALCRPDGSHRAEAGNGRIEFEYADYAIAVTEDGWILVTESA